MGWIPVAMSHRMMQSTFSHPEPSVTIGWSFNTDPSDFSTNIPSGK
jgi:hypothetical protein